MKREVNDEALAYVYNMLAFIYPKATGDMKRQVKMLMRKLQPPCTDIKLSQKQTEFLVALLAQATTSLETKTDEHSEKVKTVVNHVMGALNETT